jgi:uncharacterized protein (UPF0333 family)
MEAILETKVATAAKEILEDIKYGRNRNAKLGSQKPVVSSKPKSNLKTIASILALAFLTVVVIFEYPKCTIKGFSAVNGEGVLPNANLEFHNMNSNAVYYVKSSKEGDFKLRIPKGTYKICSKDSDVKDYYKDPKTSPIRVKIKDNTNLRVGLSIRKK